MTNLVNGLLARTKNMAIGLIGFGVTLVVWQLVAVLDLFGADLVPLPSEVVDSMRSLFRSGTGWEAIYASSRRVIIGVGVGVTLATPVGFVLGWYETVRRAVEPLINFFRALPPIALIPLVIVYLGIGETARIFVIAWASFFVSVIVIYEGVRSIEPIYVRAATVLGANSFEVFVKVVLPLSLPHILTALRVALGIGWATLVAAELIAAQTGLGAVVSVAANFFDIPRIYAGIILIGLSALVMDRLVRALSRRLIRWQDVVSR